MFWRKVNTYFKAKFFKQARYMYSTSIKYKNFIKMLKDVGMAVPKTRAVYMPQDKRLRHTTIIPCVAPLFKEM